MRSSKSRSRNKSSRQRSLGNVVNRVFDSSGPEGKVRGTPQQIIEKYLMLARDAQLSNDRVAEQSFFQHAEHYTRMLGEAQREMAERQGQNPQRTGGEDDGSSQSHGQHSNGGQNSGHQNHGHNQNGQNNHGHNNTGQNTNGSHHQGGNGQNHAPGGQGNRDSEGRDQGRDTPPRDHQPRETRHQNRDQYTQNRDPRPRREQDAPPVAVTQDPGHAEQPDLALPTAYAPEAEDRSQPVSTPEVTADKPPRAARKPRVPRDPSAAPRPRRKAPVAETGEQAARSDENTE